MQLLIATGNPGKLDEYRSLLADVPVELVGLADVGLKGMDVEESGVTFRENAEIKARAYASAANMLTLADDSGLCVDALDGGPGIYSARFGGADLDDAGRRAKLLEAIRDTPDDQRQAQFVCVIVVIDPADDTMLVTEGEVKGTITRQESSGTIFKAATPRWLIRFFSASGMSAKVTS